MFHRVLIANRGEIALRILRACKELGIETVMVYSEADADAPYLRLADQSVCIGPAAPAKSYLDISRIISAAEITDVQAIHPGYGFLAENARFAEVCRSCKIQFIGPTPEASRLLGDKVAARHLARKTKLPVIEGSDGAVDNEEEALKVAAKIGYPIMLKAAGGGGGRGMRVAHNEISLRAGFSAAQAEAQAAFKQPTLYVEKLIRNPRHVEIQILGDSFGHVIHLGERDCTLQRRHQKLLEESPSPIVTAAMREQMGTAACALARAANYTSAGTVEFLVDENLQFYFIEMNARIQVEHPVTEMVTGIDLVKEQIRIAAGERLELEQGAVQLRGHAIECRINAEDPYDGFRPDARCIGLYFPPGGMGVRVESHVTSGYRIPAAYDSLLAKVIVHRETRGEAIQAMRRALEQYILEGPATTISFLQEILGNARFSRADIDTGFVERYLAQRGSKTK